MDQGVLLGALLTYLLKAFDLLLHVLLAGTFFAFGFDINLIRFLLNYLINQKHKTKIEHAYISWENITSGVPQGLIIEPLLLNIDLFDLFFHSHKKKL